MPRSEAFGNTLIETAGRTLAVSAREYGQVARIPLPVRLKHTIGLDRAIGFTVLARGWNTLAGVVTVLLIARFLTPAAQGYYYTFASLVALQIVFELGFSFVILQSASHERAHLTISSTYVISGDPVAHGRLASVIQKAVRWYSVAAILMVATLVPVGLWFFATHQRAAAEPVLWRFPWLFTAFAAALNFQLDPILSFFEGCGFVANVARVRFAQAITGSLFAWIALVAHHGLFAPAMAMGGMALTTLVWLVDKRRFLLGLLRYRPGPHRIRWKAEIWPFQWRIAISWMCGYFIFQLFSPVLFAFKGPVAAGQMGMSLSLATALQGLAISWISTKSAPFGSMVARKEYAKLDDVFFRTLKQSMAVHILGALAAWLCLLCMNHAHIHLSQRLLSPLAFAFLLAATNVNTAVFAEALYLRAHKQEKFLLNSVFTALLTGSSTYILGQHYGAMGMVVGYLTVSLGFSLGAGTYTFAKYRRIWHA
jgi:O-antigen/teichoic acid export membrane protein